MPATSAPGLHEKLDELLTRTDFPFASLTGQIQQLRECRLSFTDSATVEREADFAIPGPAICTTRLEETKHVRNPSDRFIAPHHIIVIHIDHMHSLTGRLAVGKEIGHIWLHFPIDFRSDAELEEYWDNRADDIGVLQYSDEEHVEAYEFALELCLRRSYRMFRASLDFSRIRHAFHSFAEDFPRPDLLQAAFDKVCCETDSLFSYLGMTEQLRQIFADSKSLQKAKKIVQDLSRHHFGANGTLLKDWRRAYGELGDLLTSTNASEKRARRTQLRELNKLVKKRIRESKVICFEADKI